MKKILALLLLLSVFLIVFTACQKNAPAGDSQSGDTPDGDEGLITVGFSQVGAESDWRMANTKSMKETFTEENGYKLIFKDAQQKQENQIEALRGFVKARVDYIVIAPLVETGWDEVLAEVRDAGIPIIIADRMIDVSDDTLYACWVGSDFRSEGDAAAAWMEETLGPDLKIAHMQGTLGASAQIGRTDGLDAALAKNAGWELVLRDSGDFTEVNGKEVMERFLKENSGFDVLYCENDNMAFGAIDALRAAGKSFGADGGITIISFDATHAGLDDTLAGLIHYNVECNPLHGPRVAEIITQLQAGRTPQKLNYVDEISFDAATITQADIDARDY
ncbi:MAG: ABC transporter substrate-binding protein [Clostridiales Family XIII bacterium]|jgi:simple sugar transport system substrate-binding protein|nr:ABC transporter substrate-binding protein [Clostridiales Family XIII bacterium]